MMTMKEMCEYIKTSRRERGRKHRLEVTQGDFITGFTDKEYKKVKTPMKKASSKGRSFSHTKLWESHRYSNGIHTIYHDGTFTNKKRFT
tara:strand:- start:1324 stop:1590 length:267 start_codon:yes stop_codon:yes gene_type:complete